MSFPPPLALSPLRSATCLVLILVPLPCPSSSSLCFLLNVDVNVSAAVSVPLFSTMPSAVAVTEKQTGITITHRTRCMCPNGHGNIWKSLGFDPNVFSFSRHEIPPDKGHLIVLIPAARIGCARWPSWHLLRIAACNASAVSTCLTCSVAGALPPAKKERGVVAGGARLEEAFFRSGSWAAQELNLVYPSSPRHDPVAHVVVLLS